MNSLCIKRAMIGLLIVITGQLWSMEDSIQDRLSYNPLLLEYNIDRQQRIKENDVIYSAIPKDNVFTKLSQEARKKCYPPYLPIVSEKVMQEAKTPFSNNAQYQFWQDFIVGIPFWMPLDYQDMGYYYKLNFYDNGSVREDRKSLKLSLRDRIRLSSTSKSMRKVMLADDRELRGFINPMILKSKPMISSIEYLRWDH